MRSLCFKHMSYVPDAVGRGGAMHVPPAPAPGQRRCRCTGSGSIEVIVLHLIKLMCNSVINYMLLPAWPPCGICDEPEATKAIVAMP